MIGVDLMDQIDLPSIIKIISIFPGTRSDKFAKIPELISLPKLHVCYATKTQSLQGNSLCSFCFFVKQQPKAAPKEAAY